MVIDILMLDENSAGSVYFIIITHGSEDEEFFSCVQLLIITADETNTAGHSVYT